MAKGSNIWKLVIYVALIWGLVIIGMLYWMHASVNEAAQDAKDRRLRPNQVDGDRESMLATTDAPSTRFTTRKPNLAKLPDLQPVLPANDKKTVRQRRKGEEKEEPHVTYQNRQKEEKEAAHALPPIGTRARMIHDMNATYRKQIFREYTDFMAKEGTLIVRTKKEWAASDTPLTLQLGLDIFCTWRKENHPLRKVGLQEEDLEQIVKPLMHDMAWMQSEAMKTDHGKLNATGKEIADMDRSYDTRVMQYIGAREVIKMTRYAALMWEKLRDEKFDLENLKNLKYPKDCMAIAGQAVAEAKFMRKFDLTLNDYDLAQRMNAETIMDSADYYIKDQKKLQAAREDVTGEEQTGLMHLMGYIPWKDTHAWR